MVAGLLLIDLVLLITWQIVDPLRLKIQNLTLEVKNRNRNIARIARQATKRILKIATILISLCMYHHREPVIVELKASIIKLK